VNPLGVQEGCIHDFLIPLGQDVVHAGRQAPIGQAVSAAALDTIEVPHHLQFEKGNV